MERADIAGFAPFYGNEAGLGRMQKREFLGPNIPITYIQGPYKFLQHSFDRIEIRFFPLPAPLLVEPLATHNAPKPQWLPRKLLVSIAKENPTYFIEVKIGYPPVEIEAQGLEQPGHERGSHY